MSEYIIGGSRLRVNSGGLPLKEDAFFVRFQNAGDTACCGTPILYELLPDELEAYSKAPLLRFFRHLPE